MFYHLSSDLREPGLISRGRQFDWHGKQFKIASTDDRKAAVNNGVGNVDRIVKEEEDHRVTGRIRRGTWYQ